MLTGTSSATVRQIKQTADTGKESTMQEKEYLKLQNCHINKIDPTIFMSERGFNLVFIKGLISVLISQKFPFDTLFTNIFIENRPQSVPAITEKIKQKMKPFPSICERDV